MTWVYHLEFRCPTCGSKWREFRKFNDHRDVENQVSACKECWRTELISPISYEEVE